MNEFEEYFLRFNYQVYNDPLNRIPEIKEKKMNGKDKEFWLLEANRHLAIALIAIPDKNRVHVEKAIECLANYQQMVVNERMR